MKLFSQRELSGKGCLGTVWVAGHCFKRVKRDQIARINIPSCVDKILLDEVFVLTYRVLGYLLLGIVRMYAENIDSLLRDCERLMAKINNFVGGEKVNVHVEPIQVPLFSVTRPERFELDAFDLQITEDGNGVHDRPHEDLTLTDSWGNDGTVHSSFNKDHFDEDASHLEACSYSYTPVKDVLSPHFMWSGMTASASYNLRNSGESVEKLRGNNFFLEDRLDPMSPAGIDEELDLFRTLGEKDQTGEQIKFPGTNDINGAKEEPSCPVRSMDEEQSIITHSVKLPEIVSTGSKKCRIIRDESPASMATDVRCPYTSGATTEKFMVAQTPAVKERIGGSRKRKCLFDDDIVILPNKVIRKSIDDARDLIRKRKKVPLTALHAWKSYQINNLPQTFSEPLISGTSSELRSLFNGQKLNRPQTDIAPSTPVTLSTSVTVVEVPEDSDSDKVSHASSSDISEEEFPINYQEFDISPEVVPYEEDYLGMKESSLRRTRTVARCLRKSFLHRETRSKTNAMNLIEALKGKTKSESARIFYEILVLKTGGCIDVEQSAPFDDILVVETPKLQQLCEESTS
ncbi:sister chromatid cohesion 1 protein 2-like isoform X2 [Diospyros lotus]|uniref:sister chromatid cohesion 1 protein 2-like isoform X2 n=1 Tax=Diospyros lotus TaxID=55363 RepID=UPI00224DB2F0|nr:sister chromatid cohesion 1 protein 2-like isoform X2 [Diospyros lotus]